MSVFRRFQKFILGSLIAATASMIAIGAYLLWPQFQVFTLIHQLRSPDVDIRRTTADELGEFGSIAVEAVPALETALYLTRP